MSYSAVGRADLKAIFLESDDEDRRKLVSIQMGSGQTKFLLRHCSRLIRRDQTHGQTSKRKYKNIFSAISSQNFCKKSAVDLVMILSPCFRV